MVDIIVIGAGAAGLTSAVYALRSGKTVLVLEEETFGGQIAFSPRVENFPSIKQIKGSEFADNLFEQALSLGAQVELEKVESIDKNGDVFTVKTQYNSYLCYAVIIAVGVKHRHLNADKEKTFSSGISYCALCDGAFYSGEEVALVGDGNTALQYALLLSNSCPKVTVFTLFDKFFGDLSLVKALKSKPNIEVRPNTIIVDFIGDNALQGVKYVDKLTNVEHTLLTKALFVAIGQIPDNKKFEKFVDIDRDGYIISNEDCVTKTAGLFVAGDCRTKKVRQLTTACSDGAISALGACSYLDKLQ